MGNLIYGRKRMEAALLELGRAASAEEVWKASVKIMRAAMPVYNVLIGLPSLGITTRSRLPPLHHVHKPR